MGTIRLEIVTAERVVYSEDVDMVVLPGAEGGLGVLPRHTPVLTVVKPGELKAKKGDSETLMAIGGGFADIRPDKVTILADAAERAEEIDEARAEAARQRASLALSDKREENVDYAAIEAALKRSLVRLRVAEKKRKQH